MRYFRAFFINLKEKRQYFFVAALFLLLVLVNTFPVIKNITTHSIGDGGDVYQNMWNFWWMKEAVTNFQNPYFTPYVHYPFGSYLWLHTLSPVESFFSIFLQYLFNGNLVFTYNIIVIISLTLTGVFTYALAYYLTKHRFASFMAGYIVVFSSYMMGHTYGHLNLITVQWIPLFILFFIKFHKEQSLKNIFFSSFFFLMIILASFNQMNLVLLFSFIYFIYYLFKIKFRAQLGYFLSLALIFFIPVVLIWPIFYNSFVAFFSKNYWNWDHGMMLFFSPELLTYFIPSQVSFYAKIFSESLISSPLINRVHNEDMGTLSIENANYIGYSILFLIIYAIFKIRKDKSVRFWLISGALFFVLSLGGVLKFYGYNTGIILPYYFIYKFIPLIYVPGRFNLIVIFCIGIICAFAIKNICGGLKRGKYVAVCFLIFIVVLIEMQAIPYPNSQYSLPAIYSKMKNDSDSYAILDCSYPNNYGKAMYAQTIHGKKILNGYVSRIEVKLSQFIDNEPIISDIFKGCSYKIKRKYKPELNFVLNDEWYINAKTKLVDYNIKYVLISKKYSEIYLDGFDKVFEDEKIIAYQIF